MNIFQKFYLTFLVIFLASCSSVSTDRTNDATAISASATGAYSDGGITSNNVLYFAYDRSDINSCLLYTSPSPRDATLSRMPSSA